MRRIFRNVLYALLTISAVSCDIQGSNLDRATPAKLAAEANAKYLQVTKVVDGDTFWVDNGTDKGLKVRLTGIDAPESRKSFNKDVQYYGKESAAYLAGLIGGKRVRLVSDVSAVDRYGRALAYVYLEDGTFVNADMIKKGYAVVMTIAPNVRFAEEFARLQRTAREKKKGLWEGNERLGADSY